MTDEITINDVGTDLQITITENDAAVDISTATTLQILLRDPDGNETTKTGALINTGSDGKMHYKTVSGDIDQLGDWEYRGRVTFSPTQIYTSVDPKTFTVIK